MNMYRKLYGLQSPSVRNSSPLSELMLQSRIIQTDDTSVKLFDPLADGGSRTARFWAYLGDKDGPFGV